MTVGIVCPTCRTPLTFHQAPVAHCPKCQAELPAELRQSAEASLARQARTRPLLLSLGAYMSPGIGTLILVGVLSATTGSQALDVNGEPITTADYLRSQGALLIIVGALLIAIGVGLHRERSWARWLMAFYWILALAGAGARGWADTGAAGLAAGVAVVLPVVLVAGWYLFLKDNVVAYYRALDAYEAASGLTQVHGGA